MEDKFDSVNILGVRVDKVNMDQAVAQIGEWLEEKSGKHSIFTPNVEFIMKAQDDESFKEVLNRADLAIPDSGRLGWASKMLEEKSFWKKILIFPFFLFPKKPVIQFATVPGVDLMEVLCKQAAEKGFTIGLLGGKDGVAVKTAECLQKKYPGLKVSFAEEGGKVDDLGNVIARSDSDEVSLASRRAISINQDCHPQFNRGRNDKNVDILFVAFGQGKQEKWIAKNLSHLPVKIAMGVGGSFDYLSGQVPRAPRLFRLLGLEWLFRLILQPWRIKRQFALIRFVYLVVCNKGKNI